nr:microsomal triglyceride transfer protein large subunit [Onthophagus taurus]
MENKMCKVVFGLLLCGLSSGFVLTSSTSDEFENGFLEKGKTWVYDYSSKTQLSNKNDPNQIGFLLKATVIVESVWDSSDFNRILKISVTHPKIFLQSPKSSDESKIKELNNEDFYVLWKNGVVDRILLRKQEDLGLVNLKKGIVSLFQLKFEDQTLKEQDSSGICDVTYQHLDDFVEKTKKNCENFDLSYVFNTEPILSTKTISSISTIYKINKKEIENAISKEHHEIFLQAKEEIGGEILIEQNLKLISTKKSENVMNQRTYDQVKQKLIDDFGDFKEENLLTQKDFSNSQKPISFANLINEFRDNLKSKNLGKLISAKTIIPLINAAKKSNKDEILKVLNAKKNQKILPQLYDILAYVQTDQSHEAVMKKLHFDDSKNEDNNERYLWGCQLVSNPNPNIVIDLLNKFKKTENVPKKIQETLLLSISSMTSKLSNLNKLGYSKIVGIVKETLLNNLDVANHDDKIMYLRALRNLKSSQTIFKLLEIIRNKKSGVKEEVLAWKALKSMNNLKDFKDVLIVAYKTYFQLDKKHDSSSRTLAGDVLLQSDPSDDLLEDFLHYLLNEDKEYEVKKYVLQQIEMMAEDDVNFKARVLKIIRNNKKLNNYSGLSPKGLSLSLRRKFMDSKSINGSLLTIQEMSNGIVKRGIVNVVMDQNNDIQELASLGIFSGGLGTFMSSDSSEEDETTTAGMELAILGTQIRPFIFFEGQGELMGHVWSGTASERTTAFQALILIQDHQEYLRLGPGFIIDVDFKGAASFDLAGKIEMSLWNRNAQALIEKSLGYEGIGSIILDNSFANLKVEFKITVEPSLFLNADIDFSSKVALCMRLSQPETEFRSVIKKEINGKDALKISQRKSKIPGRTYALNKKNDEKCTEMFNT